MTWDRWSRRLLFAGVAILSGTFARHVYEAKVREVGRAFRAGDTSTRAGTFTCRACGARFPVVAGGSVPACPSCGHVQSIKTG